MTMLLAIDTASHLAGIALYDENGVAAEHTWTSRAHHTVDLVPNIVTLLKQQGLTAADLGGLAVGHSPSSAGIVMSTYILGAPWIIATFSDSPAGVEAANSFMERDQSAAVYAVAFGQIILADVRNRNLPIR